MTTKKWVEKTARDPEVLAVDAKTVVARHTAALVKKLAQRAGGGTEGKYVIPHFGDVLTRQLDEYIERLVQQQGAGGNDTNYKQVTSDTREHAAWLLTERLNVGKKGAEAFLRKVDGAVEKTLKAQSAAVR